MKLSIRIRKEVSVDDQDKSLCDPTCRFFDIAPERCTLFYKKIINRKRCTGCIDCGAAQENP